MGYTHCKELHEGRRGQVDYRYQRSYDRTFLVRTDDPSYGVAYAGSCPYLPVVWSAHPEDTTAFCNGIIPVADPTDPCLWRVTCTYIYRTVPGESIPDPLDRPTDYEVDGVTWKEAVWMDRDNNAIKNSAGDPFIPPVEVPRAGAVLIAEFNLADAPDESWYLAQGKLNAATMAWGPYIFTAERLMLEKVKAKRIWEIATPFWRWTTSWVYKGYMAGTWRQAHRTVLLDQGRRELRSGVPVPIRDLVTGIQVDQPVPLDGSGVRLPPSTPEVYLAFDTLHTTVFPDI